MRINKTIKLSLVSVLLVFGCLPQKELLNTSTPVTTAKKVIPYTGPVELKIDTSIAERLGVKTEKKEVILESEEEKTFSINSVPSGNIVFQETFKIEHKERLFTRNFTINDTSKRYTIHLQRKSPCDAVARVNINGMNWILPSDFKRRTQLEVSKSSLLLNNSNSLQIRLKGNPKDEITLSIVEGGEVGTVKRRLGKLSNTKTNEERLLANDTNIFYPNNEDSLGDLKAFDGEKEIVEGNNSYRIGLTDVNDGTSKFRIGEVSATVREPVEENLQTLLSRYNATLLSRKKYDDNEIVIIKPDLNSTNLDKIMSNVKSLNLYSEEPLTKLTFSSINTAKTVANFIDILVNSGDLISNAGLLIQFDKNGITTQESSDFVNINRSFRNKNYNKDLNLCKGKEFTIKNPRTSDDMWWLKDTKITDAWDYSMGQNTSVAIFDGSFGQYWNSPEFKDRSENRYNCSDNNSSNIASCQEYKECGHGYAIASFIGAELDNNFGIVGVSPRSKIISYPTSDIDNIADNLNKAKTELSLKKIDVINISSGGFLSTLDRIATDKNPNCSIEFGKGNIRHRICNTFVRQMVIDMDNLSNNKKLYDGSQNPYYDPNKRSVVIVSTAGNDGKELRSDGARDDFFFPGQSLNVIGVGAYELSGVDQGNPNTGERIRADFCLSSNIPLISSNYGLPIDIWAPGDNLSIFEQSKQHIGDMDISVCGILQNQWLSWGGTSHAAPIVSGVISLLKSIDKNLDVNDVRRILQETGDTLNHPSFLSSNGQKSLNALKAVQSLTSSKFDTFTGTLLHSDLFIVNPNLSLVLDTNYPSRYKEFVGKKVIVEAWKTPGKDSYGVRRIKLQSDDFIASNPKGIINTNPSGIALEVKPNNIIALPIPSSTRDLSKFSISLGGGQNITLKEIVDDYLIAKIPPTLPQGIQDIIIREAGGGTLTYTNAIRVLAGLSVLPAPTTPVKFPNSTTIPPSEEDLNRKIYTTELISNGVYASKTLREIIVEWASNGIVVPVRENVDKEFIKALAKPLKITPGYDTTSPNYEVSLDLLALSLGYQPSSCPSLTNYTCTGDRWSRFTIPSNSFINTTTPVEVQPNQSIGIALDGDLKGLQITSEGQGFAVQGISKEFVSVEIPSTLSAGVHDINVKTDLGEVIFREAINIRTNNQIAFDSNRDGNEEIYVMESDGSNQRRLTFTEDRYDYGATWSPNKEKIAFDSEHFSGEEDIFVVNPDGTGMMNLTNSPDDEWDPFWSYDGTKITFISDALGNDDICEINADGTNRRQLTTDSADEYNPSYSPDGSKIVYVSEVDGTAEIYIMNSDGSGKTRLTNSSYGNGRPKWSMTGKKISWESYTANNDSHIWQMNPDGSGKEQLTFNDDYRPWYSPDGTKMAYHTYINNDRRDIKVLDLRTRVETNLTAVNPSKTLFDGWLNDSSKVLYSSKMDGDYEIYSQRYDGSDLRQLTFNTSDDFNAAAHSHREVFTTLSMSQVEKTKLAKRRAKYDIPERHYWKLKK